MWSKSLDQNVCQSIKVNIILSNVDLLYNFGRVLFHISRTFKMCLLTNPSGNGLSVDFKCIKNMLLLGFAIYWLAYHLFWSIWKGYRVLVRISSFWIVNLRFKCCFHHVVTSSTLNIIMTSLSPVSLSVLTSRERSRNIHRNPRSYQGTKVPRIEGRHRHWWSSCFCRRLNLSSRDSNCPFHPCWD